MAGLEYNLFQWFISHGRRPRLFLVEGMKHGTGYVSEYKVSLLLWDGGKPVYFLGQSTKDVLKKAFRAFHSEP